MKREEQADIAKATGVAINEVADTVEGMHKAIADPVFSTTAKLLGKAFGFEDRVDLDSLTESRSNFGLRANIYRAVRGTSSLTTQGAAWVFGMLDEEEDAASIQDAKGGATAIAALTTAFGDNLKRAGSSLAPEMNLKVDGQTVVPLPDEIAAAYPNATSSIVVSIHGLGGTEYVWSPKPDSDDDLVDVPPTFGQQLSDDYGFTPVFVRYNTGANIHENGTDFALLMQLLYDNWPVPVENIVLIGHSMGGLVVRSACAQVEAAASAPLEDPWTSKVSQIFYVGSPHRGAPLERVSNQAIELVGKFKRSAPLVPLLNRRSAGIKDLRFGTLLAEELGDGADDPDSNHRALVDHQQIEPLATAEHHLIVGTKLAQSKGKAAALVGDTIVPVASASSSADDVNRTDFPDGHLHFVEGVAHIPMVVDQRIFAVIDAEVGRLHATQ